MLYDMKTKQPIKISAEEFDRRFDEGEDITPFLDLSSARRPGREPQRVDEQPFAGQSALREK
jgi:hypothetical protein